MAPPQKIMAHCIFISSSTQKPKYSAPPHSPFGEKYEEDEMAHNNSGNDSRHASASQKPEWKRYKQYTRQDLNDAIQAVKGGMSALQASRLYKVPSRTLYDKVKKLGIVGARPLNRAIKRSPSNNGSPASFPYGLSGVSGTDSPLPHQFDEQSHSQALNDSENAVEMEQRERERFAGMIDPNLFLKALKRSGDMSSHEALMALAAKGIKNLSRQSMSQSPSPVYPEVNQSSQSATPNSK